MTFIEKCFSWYILLGDQILLSNCLYFLRYWAICVLQLFYFLVVMSWILKLTLFFNEAVFLHDQKVKTKVWISWEHKEFLRWNKKHFSSFLKSLSCQKLSQTWDCAFMINVKKFNFRYLAASIPEILEEIELFHY